MLEGVFQPMHLMVMAILVGAGFLVSRVFWRLGSKSK